MGETTRVWDRRLRSHGPVGGRQDGGRLQGRRHRRRRVWHLLFGALLWPTLVFAAEFAPVARILAERCIVCHSGANAVQGLRLDSHAGIMAGSARGPVVKPGDPDGSELIRRLRGVSQPRMPLTGPPYLDDAQVAVVSAWIAAGARADAGGQHPLPAARPSLPAPGAEVRFGHVAPILLQRCVKCHGPQSILGAAPEGLQLGALDAVLRGGDRVVVVPGHPGASELYRRIAGLSLPRMPFDGPPYLADEEIRVLGEWIAQGAKDDAGRQAPMPVGAPVRLQGTLDGYWQVDGTPLQVGGGTRIDKSPRIGDRVEVRGSVAADGGVAVSRLRRR